MLARGENVKDCYRCGGSGTTDNQIVSTLFLRMTVHSEPCYGTIARALPLVVDSAEMQAPGLCDIFAQVDALCVRNGRTGWSGVHHLHGRCIGCAAGGHTHVGLDAYLRGVNIWTGWRPMASCCATS